MDIVDELRECHCYACRDQGTESVHQRAAAEIESLRKQFIEDVSRILAKAKENLALTKEVESRLDRAGL